MITPHLDLKVGLGDTKSQVFQFSLRIPFWKGATKCYKLSHEQQAALLKFMFKKKIKIVITIAETTQ